jgi:hypothetical protein
MGAANAKKRARRTELAYYNAAKGARQIFSDKNCRKRRQKEKRPTLRERNVERRRNASEGKYVATR